MERDGSILVAWQTKADWLLSETIAYIGNPAAPDISLVTANNPQMRPPGEKAALLRTAKRALWDALSDGRLTATGIINGARKPIPAYDWQDLDLPRDPIPLLSRAERKPSGTIWNDISVRRDDVVQVFGDGKPGPELTASSTRTGKGAKTDLARVAINSLWPHGIPKGFSNGELHQLVIDWCKRNGHSHPPGKRTFDGIIVAAKKQNAK